MAVSINWGSFFVGVLVIRALLFGVDIRAPDVWNFHIMTCMLWFHIFLTWLEHLMPLKHT